MIKAYEAMDLNHQGSSIHNANWFSITKVRQWWAHLIFTVGIAIPGKMFFLSKHSQVSIWQRSLSVTDMLTAMKTAINSEKGKQQH